MTSQFSDNAVKNKFTGKKNSFYVDPKFRIALETFTHFQLTKLFHELDGRSHFYNSFMVALPNDFGMSEIYDCASSQQHFANKLSTDFVNIEFQALTVDDFFEPTLSMVMYMEPVDNTNWDCMMIEAKVSPDLFDICHIDYGMSFTATPIDQWVKLTDRIQHYLAEERKHWKYF